MSAATIANARPRGIRRREALIEAVRRPALRVAAHRWTEVYLQVLGGLMQAAGSKNARADAELLLGAANGLLLDQLASGETTDLRPRLGRP